MARISQISLNQQPGHYYLFVRRTIDFMREYAGFVEEAVEQTTAYLQAQTVLPMAGLTVCFHNEDLEHLVVDVGWTLAAPVGSPADMHCIEVPSRKVACVLDQGSYEGQDATLNALCDWIREKGYQEEGPIYYHYLNDDQRPPAEFLIQMQMPVK